MQPIDFSIAYDIERRSYLVVADPNSPLLQEEKWVRTKFKPAGILIETFSLKTDPLEHLNQMNRYFDIKEWAKTNLSKRMSTCSGRTTWMYVFENAEDMLMCKLRWGQ